VTTPENVAAPVPRVTVRAVATGLVLAVLLCAMNSYLTLSFGVIEEGPTIAALFFFAIFFVSKLPITATEMVIVATMGSAGGSFGFISNFYAAKAMTGEPYSLVQMASFGVVSSMVGLIAVVPLRQLLILREELPWPGSKAVAGVITALVEEGDPRQPKILLLTLVAMMFVVITNNDGGYGWLPAETALGGLAIYGGAIAWSPFAIGGSYLMGFRTCVGFLFGASALMVMAPHLPEPAAPHHYFWPGIGFLVASGLVGIALNWRSFAESFRSMLAIGETTDDTDPVLPGKVLLAYATVAVIAAAIVLRVMFDVPILAILVVIAVGGLLQNFIATRAQAQTAFNPARVMGILMQGLTFAAGGSTPAVNLTGAGLVAGSGAQAGMLTADMAYGRWFRVPSRWQFWAQASTVIPSAIVSALVFDQIRHSTPITMDAKLPAPVAKMWAASAQIFSGSANLPSGAVKALVIGAVIGVVYTLLERIPRLTRWIPETTGVGLGLVLSPSYGLSFFLGGFLMWIVLGRWLELKDVSLTTVAVGCIVAEGIGGVIKPLLTLAGLNPQ
jgi:uncharacterized oligopeptide transporter (OPT) family protein